MGQRFCLFHPPAAGKCRGAVLYVHPFADEMNRARRMGALQARELAALGFGVLQMDLHGCGDSSGEFGDARWEIWKEDLAIGSQWLLARLGKPVSLWGLRLGALLALDYAKSAQHAIGNLILWQPVQSGAAYLTQFLRLRMAHRMLAASKEKNTGTQAMRAALQAGEILEVGGYDIAPEMAAAMDSMDAAELVTTACPVHWFEVVSAAGRTLPPASTRVTSTWEQSAVDLHVHLVPCLPFWATQEVAECHPLLAATSAVFRDASHGV